MFERAQRDPVLEVATVLHTGDGGCCRVRPRRRSVHARPTQIPQVKHSIELRRDGMNLISCWVSALAGGQRHGLGATESSLDSSPIIWDEFQGMVMGICMRGGQRRQIVLPGASLYYRHCSSLNKSITLLWMRWLVAGPTSEDMVYFICKVTCITTDDRVEALTLSLPNVLRSLLAWNAGSKLCDTVALVNHSERLL